MSNNQSQRSLIINRHLQTQDGAHVNSMRI